MGLYSWLRPILFRLDAEQAHDLALRALWLWGMLPGTRRAARRAAGPPGADLAVEAFGLRFPNPLGLAAGFDKKGLALAGLARLGFGHIEVGTVTPQPQAGNPRPRVFRLVEDQALINRMGFPNPGAQVLAARLRRRPAGVVVGVNLGKGARTPLEQAAEDYRQLLRTFYPLADYCAINVSSPNTLGLRRLQSRRHLDGLLGLLMEERGRLAEASGRRVPLLVKLSPDLQPADLRAAVEACLEHGVEGVIATNTTRNRQGTASPLARQAGGLSGQPLFERALGMVARIHELAGERLPIIGVGGIMSGADARRMQEAGAALVQVYTGLIYRGPRLIGEILGALGDGEAAG